METIHHELLIQFQSGGFSIESGMAVDARLVRSASRPLSKEKLRKETKKRVTAEGRLDKNGTPFEYCRDLDSDWTVKKQRTGFRHEGTCIDRRRQRPCPVESPV
jgi:IS5 family transposase